MSIQVTSLIIVLLIASSSLALDDYNSVFTKEIKIPRGRHPFKLNNELKLFESNTLISLTPGHDDCTLHGFNPRFGSNNGDTIHILGNGKLFVANPKTVAKFQLLELHNCTSYVSSTLISNDTSRLEKRRNYDGIEQGAVVPYNDTFDVFDWYQKRCMPCRYNDKGELLKVEFPLTKEPTGQHPDWAYQHQGFSLDFIEDDFGVKNGYFYVFRYVSDMSFVRILDSQFKVLKQQLFPAKILAHSSSHGSITVCYTKNACNKYVQHCEYVECHLLNGDLKSTAVVKLHQVSNNTDTPIHAEFRVKNLIGGGAMVAMQFQFDRSNAVHHKDIFIQRIRPDGTVDQPIKFDSVDNDFVNMNDFTFDNGEYCLITVNDYYKKGSYTLIKCLNTLVVDEDY